MILSYSNNFHLLLSFKLRKILRFILTFCVKYSTIRSTTN
nr:MAG TPA: hypothetical protein [Caudoviricetes sp.]